MNDTGSTQAGWPLLLDDKSDSILPMLPDSLAGELPGACEPMATVSSSPPRRRVLSVKPRRESRRRLPGANRWMEEVLWRLVGTFVFWTVLVVILSPYLSHRLSGGKAEDSSPELSEHQSVATSGEPFATVMSTMDCRWQDGSHSFEEGASIGAEKIELLSGTVELAFGDGARVVLEGPACLVASKSWTDFPGTWKTCSASS